ncbi:hypothetical protein [Agrobacterium cavarae]|uniref:hypothetical protein n=1 Tax=Agrobacterium cavarae TaxID=2528239 RepID=UPI002FD88084
MAEMLTAQNGKIKGLLSPGNIDLSRRPVVKNADGSISTVRSMSFNEDGREILVPTVSPEGGILSEDQAIDLYHKSGQHLGMFDNPDDATTYAQTLHGQQEKMYAQPDMTRIKNNVRKMVDQNAPEHDIDGYIASEGVTIDDVRNFKMGATSAPKGNRLPEEKSGLRNAADTVDAYGRGIANSATFGLADEIGAGARWLGGKILPWQPNVTYDQALDEVRGSDKATAAAHPVADIAGNVTGAVGLAGGVAKLGLSPTAAVAKGARTTATTGWKSLAAMSGASAVEGGAMGAAYGFGSGEGGFQNRLEQAKNSGLTGAAVGAALPVAVSGAVNGVRRLISPLSTSQARQSLVNTLEREGIDVTAGQATGSDRLRYAESEIGGRAAQNIAKRQGEQFTKAALSRAGIQADRATPDVIDGAFTRIGKQFDDLASRNTLMPDKKLARDLGDTWQQYREVTNESARAPIVDDVMTDLRNVFKGGKLDGAAYQSLSSRLDRAARGSSDPNLAGTLRDIRSSLDEAMERSIAVSNPKDLGGWRKARKEYRNMLVLEQAATGAGENAAAGIISPSALRNATVSKQGRRNYARGNGDFAELSRAGAGIMAPMPQSGTAPRTAIRNFGASLPTVLGAGAGGVAGGGFGAVAGMAAGAALPAFVGKMMMTKPGQAYLKNQLLSGSISPVLRAKIASAINSIDASFLPRIMEDGQSKVPATASGR